MSTFFILIIDHEQSNVSRLRHLLQRIRPNHQIVAVLGTVQESVQWLRVNPHPHLILMAIRLADGICTDIFRQVKLTIPVIFTTAYDKYLMQAFSVYSIDYLLKPIDVDELTEAITKVEYLHPDQLAPDPTVLYTLLVGHYKKQIKCFRQRILVPTKEGFTTLDVQDVAYFLS